MKSIFTWQSLRMFVIFYFCVLCVNVLISIITSDFDIATQFSTKNFLFNIITAAFITLIRLARQERLQHQGTKA